MSMFMLGFLYGFVLASAIFFVVLYYLKDQ